MGSERRPHGAFGAPRDRARRQGGCPTGTLLVLRRKRVGNDWCRGRDLNPYGLAATSPSSWRVYLFHHLGPGTRRRCREQPLKRQRFYPPSPSEAAFDLTGSSTRHSDPCPSTLRTAITPPWPSAIHWAIANPSPLPSRWRSASPL